MKTLNELKREEHEHVSDSGGWLGLHESDDTLNDLNRKQIAAFVREYGAAWLGRATERLPGRLCATEYITPAHRRAAARARHGRPRCADVR